MHYLNIQLSMKTLTDFDREKNIKISLTGVSAHDLEKGRHHNIHRNLRLCKHCSTQILENEFHFMLVCTKHRWLCNTYLKPYYLH